MNRKKQSNETMVAYMRDVQRFVGKLNVHATDQDEYTCTAFLNGLPSKMLMTMRSMQGKTVNE